jgi:FkbM family methyltransferase
MNRPQYLDERDCLALRENDVYERNETRYIKTILKPGMTVVDVGAHIGYYTTIAARIVGPAGRVHAFEPRPENVAVLRQNAALFGETVVVHEAAVSDLSGRGRLYLDADRNVDGRLAEMPGRESVVVDITTLDEALPDAVVDFLKSDAQGWDGHVLRGAERLLRRSPQIVGMIEFLPQFLKFAGDAPEDIIAYLRDLGFKTYVVRGSRRTRFTPKLMPKMRIIKTLFFKRGAL